MYFLIIRGLFLNNYIFWENKGIRYCNHKDISVLLITLHADTII